MYNDEVNAEQMVIVMQLKVLQESLTIINQQLREIDNRVKAVISGQQNDRLGIYYSVVALYIESMHVCGLEMRKNLISQSIRALTEVIFQMTLMMQSEIRYLKNRDYEYEKKKRTELIKEKMRNIN